MKTSLVIELRSITNAAIEKEKALKSQKEKKLNKQKLEQDLLVIKDVLLKLPDKLLEVAKFRKSKDKVQVNIESLHPDALKILRSNLEKMGLETYIRNDEDVGSDSFWQELWVKW